jgi:uncharacterized cupredoxin-like copper-binding protein
MSALRYQVSPYPFILRLIVIVFALSAVLLAPFGIVRAQDGTPVAEPDPVPIESASAATLGYPALTIIATDSGFVVPEGITAGRYYETHRNAGTFWSHFFTLRVPDEVTDEELAASMQTDEDPEWLFEADVVGNADQTLPGQENHAIVDLAAGRYILIDPIRGLVGTFSVTEATSTEPPAEPDADFDVVMKEMDFEGLNDTVPAGQTIWKVTNAGSIWHEAVIIRVPDGTTEERMLAEANSEEDEGPGDEFIDSLVQGSAVISPGNTAWMIVDLEPGTYAVICTFPSDDGRVHAMDGMLKVITVA